MRELAFIMSKDPKDDCFYRVTIETEENVPHLHFYKTSSDFENNKGGCINLIKPEYANHGSHQDTLNSIELKNFINWLNKPNKHIRVHNNYQACCVFWNVINEDNISIDSMPDYNALSRCEKCE